MSKKLPSGKFQLSSNFYRTGSSTINAPEKRNAISPPKFPKFKKSNIMRAPVKNIEGELFDDAVNVYSLYCNDGNEGNCEEIAKYTCETCPLVLDFVLIDF